MTIHRICQLIIHILIFLLLIAFFINNRKNNTNLILVLVATIIYICYLYEFVKRPDINKIDLNKEYFSAPVDYKMGPYSGLGLHNDGKYDLYTPKYKKPESSNECKWRKRPCNMELHSEIKFTTPTGIDQRYVEDPDHNPTMPSVDGQPGSKKSLFMFTHNQCHPDCCPSTYSCDKGCVCTTEQQRKFINRRGKNRSTDIYPGI